MLVTKCRLIDLSLLPAWPPWSHPGPPSCVGACAPPPCHNHHHYHHHYHHHHHHPHLSRSLLWCRRSSWASDILEISDISEMDKIYLHQSDIFRLNFNQSALQESFLNSVSWSLYILRRMHHYDIIQFVFGLIIPASFFFGYYWDVDLGAHQSFL